MCALEIVRSDGHNDHMKRKPLKLPPKTVGIAEAKRDLTSLIQKVLDSGKPVTIARRGKPVVELSPIRRKPALQWRPDFVIPADDPFWKAARESDLDPDRRELRRGTPSDE